MAKDIMVPNPLRDKILARAKKGTIAQFKVKTDIIYQEELDTFKKAYVILDMFKDFGIGCGLPEKVTIDPIIIPLPHLTPSAMEAIIRWCYHHKDDPDMTEEDLNNNLYHCTGEIKDEWDIEHYDTLDEDTLFDLVIAAKYLGIPEMRDSLTTYIASSIVQGVEDKEKGNQDDDESEEEEEEGKTVSSSVDQPSAVSQDDENKAKGEASGGITPTKSTPSISPPDTKK